MTTALITGGARRIGRALALTYAENGLNIALHYNHSHDSAQETAALIRKKNVQCQLFEADLTKMDQVQGLIPAVEKVFGQCHVLINNASIFKKAAFQDTDELLFDEAMAVHLKAPFFLMQAFARMFQSGLIINLLDTKITSELTSYMAYSLSKKALADLTRLAARALGPAIRVNGIAPGIILPSQDTSQEMVDRIKLKLPLQKQGTPEQIAHAALFLWQNPYITGDILFVDGGEHLN